MHNNKNLMSDFDMRLEQQRDSQKALQNWIEKYEPLKVQHQITETLSVCINRKSRLKLAEYDLQVCAALREAILADFGVPTIKEKILDLITQMERESQKVTGIFNLGSEVGSPKKGGGAAAAGSASPTKKPSLLSAGGGNMDTDEGAAV